MAAQTELQRGLLLQAISLGLIMIGDGGSLDPHVQICCWKSRCYMLVSGAERSSLNLK